MTDENHGTCCLCGAPIDPSHGEPCAARIEAEDGSTEEWRWHSRCFGDAAREPIQLRARD